MAKKTSTLPKKAAKSVSKTPVAAKAKSPQKEKTLKTAAVKAPHKVAATSAKPDDKKSKTPTAGAAPKAVKAAKAPKAPKEAKETVAKSKTAVAANAKAPAAATTTTAPESTSQKGAAKGKAAAKSSAEPKVAKAKSARTKKSAEQIARETICEHVSATVGYCHLGKSAPCVKLAEGSTGPGYCRLHYIKNWKKIKRKELILKEGKLNQYIEELISKYPDKYIEAIRLDLSDDKAFAKVIHDLELDENIEEISDMDEDSDDNIIDNIKREFDDTDTDF